MRILIVRGDLQSHSGYAAATRDYCRLLATHFDRIVGVDLHFARERPFEPFGHPLVNDAEAEELARSSSFALQLSLTTPDRYVVLPHAVNVGLTFWECNRPPLGLADRMNRLWAPSRHTRAAFREAGVRVPIRVVPWPLALPPVTSETATPGLPEGEIFDLDRTCATLVRSFARLRPSRDRWPNRILNTLASRAQASLLRSLRAPTSIIASPDERAFLCVAQDVPRKGLLLLLSEWLEFKRRPEAEGYVLILKCSPANPATPGANLVLRFWDHVQSLRRSCEVDRTGVYLWKDDLPASAFAQLMAATFGQVTASLGEGFGGPAAMALALGKPLIAPRHTAFRDYLPQDYRYAYPTRPGVVEFAADPLHVYHPASTWRIPEPLGLADALSRLVTDTRQQRQQTVRPATDRLLHWTGQDRVGAILADELARLERIHRAASVGTSPSQGACAINTPSSR